jgi:TolA-binding protein
MILFVFSVSANAQVCDEGVIRLPDRNGTVQICSAISAKLPQLQKQLQEATQSILSQKVQISELTRLVRGMNSVSRQVDVERQAEMLKSLAQELTRATSQGGARASRSLTAMVDGVDDLQAQMLAVASKQGGQAELSSALAGEVGDSIAKLEFGSAMRQLDVIDRRLRNIEQHLGDVKSDTGQILQQVGRIESQLGNIAKNFEQLRSSSTLIPNPNSPVEFYSNALQYEARGDMLNARQSYRSFLDSGAVQFDPVERYVKLVTATEGRAGAKQTLRVESQKQRPVAVQAYLHTLEEPSDAAPLLRDLIQKYPHVGPLHFLLARQFGEERLGQQSLNDQQQELAALGAFLEAHRRGEVLRYFIDQRVASEWISLAEKLVKRLSGVERVKASLTLQPSHNGWQVQLLANEPVRRAFYRLSQSQPLVDMGQLNFIDQETRQPVAQSYFTTSRNIQLDSIEVFYDDISRVRRGPIKLPFELTDPLKATASWQRGILDQTSTSWVGFTAHMPIMYFTHLASYRCAIREVRWGWGKTLDQTLQMAPCDLENLFSVPKDNASFMVRFEPLTIPSPRVSVQLTYLDGSFSDMKFFEIPNSIWASLQRTAQEASERKSQAEAKFDDLYEKYGYFMALWNEAFGPDGQRYKSRCKADEPCDLRKAYGFWSDAEAKLSKKNCLSPLRITDMGRYKFFYAKGFESGVKVSRKNADQQEELLALISNSCDAVLAAKRLSLSK